MRLVATVTGRFSLKGVLEGFAHSKRAVTEVAVAGEVVGWRVSIGQRQIVIEVIALVFRRLPVFPAEGALPVGSAVGCSSKVVIALKIIIVGAPIIVIFLAGAPSVPTTSTKFMTASVSLPSLILDLPVTSDRSVPWN